nr:MAG TPA: hypothetical protein [Caudoviricetes sp.]
MKYIIKYKESGRVIYANSTEEMEKIVDETTEEICVRPYTAAGVFLEITGIPLFEREGTEEVWSLSGQKVPMPCSRREAIDWIEEYERASTICRTRCEKSWKDGIFPGLILDEKEIMDWSYEELSVIFKMKGRIMYLLEEAEKAGNTDVPGRFFGHYLALVNKSAREALNVYFQNLYTLYKCGNTTECLQYERRLSMFLAAFFPDDKAGSWKVKYYCKKVMML